MARRQRLDVAASAGRRDEAIEYLGKAVDHGYKNAEAMKTEKDLKSLQRDPRFHALLVKADQPANAVQKSN